jgi:hypothetical protein
MNEGEYTDGYQPEHPELIPENTEQADTWIKTALDGGLASCSKETFLRAWWAFSWLNPGFHPDDCDEWTELPNANELTNEAIRRAELGEIDGDSEFYATEAAHNAVWLARIGSPNAPTARP